MNFKENYDLVYLNIRPTDELIQKTKLKMHQETRRAKRRILPKLSWVGAAAACAAVSVIAAFAATGGWNQEHVLDNVLPEQEQIAATSTPALEISPPSSTSPSSHPTESASSEQLVPDTDRVMSARSIRLSKGEAYAHEIYGRFLPRVIPAGYSFESANIYNSGTVSESFSFLHCRNYSDIRVLIREYRETDQSRLVKSEETERYDITQYKIPFADSIPKDLWEVMNNPIFLADELTEDIIKMRIIKSNESGEGEKQSVHFSLKCGEFLVEYSIEANSMDGVYDMIRSADYF